jgi:hypothetical protein
MARWVVEVKGVSIRQACADFTISATCYRYQPKRSDENAVIADWLIRLTHNQRNWGFGLCFLHLRADTQPPLIDRDSRVGDDLAWREAAQRYLVAKKQSEDAAAALDDAKAALVALASHPSESGCGVSLTKFWKRGAVDYKKVPALKGVDLEAFRGTSRMETRVTAN